MKLVSTHTVNGSVKIRYVKMSAPSVSYRWNFVIVVYSAPRIAICGKIVIESIRYMTNERPWNLKRPSAYAANEPMMSDRIVTDPATMVELISASWKNGALNAPR